MKSFFRKVSHAGNRQQDSFATASLGGRGPGAEPAAKSSAKRGILRNPLIVAMLIGVVALSIFLTGIGRPAQTYYDEAFYIPAAKAFLADAPNPNPGSPPLGKYLIAGGIQLFGDGPFGWRIASAVCGSLTLTAVFLWTYLLTWDLRIAGVAAALTLFNNFLFVMSRLAMLDVFLVFFLFWGLVAYTAALELEVSAGKRRILLWIAGTSIGLGAACKLNAVDTLAALISASVALPWIAKRSAQDSHGALFRYAQNLRQAGLLSVILGLIVAPLISYSLAFWPLCRSLHVPFGIRQLAEMNVFMWRFKVSVEINQVIASPWYNWPFHIAPQRGLSYLLGNPVVMWGGMGALVIGLRRVWKSLAVAEGLLVLLYAANLTQWAFTPVKATFYYYYYPAAMLLGVAVALALRSLPRSILGIRLSLLVVAAAAVVFLWCYPQMAHLEAPWDCVFGCWS